MPDKQTILIADDNEMIVELIKEALSREKYNFITANTGKGVLELIMGNNNISLLISDIQMPGLNGIAILNELKKNNIKLPVIMISGMATETTKEKALQLGTLCFMEKPLEIPKLISTVNDALSKQSAQQIGKKESILVIDDYEPTCAMLEAVLTSAGYMVHTAENGIKGLEKIQSIEKPYDYAMIDIHMPEMDGITFVGKLKEIAPETLPIIMTGEADTDEIRQAYKEGGYTLIKKPFDIPQLLYFFSQLKFESNELKKKVLKKKKFQKLPFYKRAIHKIKKDILFAPSSSPKKRLFKNILIILIIFLIAIVALQSMIIAEKYLSKGHSKIEGFVNEVLGYLERDEARELEKNRGFKRIPGNNFNHELIDIK